MVRTKAGSSGALWYGILVLWLIGTVLLAWRFLPDIAANPVPLLPIFLLACLSYFLLTGVFNVVVNVVSHRLRDPRPTAVTARPSVAVFYCTYNDFERSAAETLLDLTYPNLAIWMLDDSTDPEHRQRVDAFARDAARRGKPVQVVRRPDRSGFKAGAINHALALLPKNVAYVAIADSDERLVPDFVQRCLAHFTREDIAFVQANHVAYNKESGWFTRYLGIGVDLHWRHYQRYRNRYGTVNMLGHGAIVRRDVLDRLGGFPLFTCEDLAFTVKARLAGYRGAFAADVVCGETFPEDFSAMRRRHFRWSWATVEFLRHHLRPILRGKIPVHEKMDILLPSVNLPAVFLLVAFFAAVYGSHWANVSMAAFRDPVVIGLGVFASLAPLAMFIDLFRRPGFALKAIVVNTAAYLALFPVSVVGVLRGVSRPAEFLVTPKGTKDRLTLRRAIREARVEVAFGGAMLLLGILAFGPAGATSPIGWAALGTPLLMVSSRAALQAPAAAGPPPVVRGLLDNRLMVERGSGEQ